MILDIILLIIYKEIVKIFITFLKKKNYTNEDNNILLKLCDFLLKGFNLRTVTSILPTGYTLYWFKVTIMLYYSLFYQLEYIYICK